MSFPGRAPDIVFSLSRSWRQGNLPWKAWASASFVALVIASVAAFWFQRQGLELPRDHDLGAEETIRSLAPRAPGASAVGELNYAERLQTEARAADWARDMQRTTGQFGVQVVSMTDTPREATSSTLGRHDLQLTLRGSYPQIKLVLKELLDRYPSTTVGRLTLRSMTNPLDVEASVQLTRWTRPIPAAEKAAATATR